jgi:hypothetical protein
MKFIQEYSKAYRTKGAKNKNSKAVEELVERMEFEAMSYIPGKVKTPEEKEKQYKVFLEQRISARMEKEGPYVTDENKKELVKIIQEHKAKKEPFMIDGNVIYDWLVCLKENKQDNKNYNADSKHLMDEILEYIDRQREKQ